ncbi:Tetratricopeptide repeat-containing protein [Thermomonospora echinospora]|uniref:Tetratricopeptide repeat-containing protein n=1 Tax=Thermomonospora echinospora TaxID=1992 RepID=A0A1H5XY25_9ACTN|nr:FxSxx-COOH system tetratricopeptide repeat protein [Thermomonospora echinospora]SEG16186.1 Tetratricopeptide repeat-containing protein [Thermomonospora echinospora]
MTQGEYARAGRLREPIPDVWGKIPPRNKNFTGREELLSVLQQGITGQVTAVVPHALHGLGGVGKTQMAIEYAWRFRSDYDLVWWIPADQPILVRSSLAALAPYLGLPPASTTGTEEAANAVLETLRRGEPYSRWLLIFDNADEPEELNDVLPRGPGHVLITSRNHRWEAVVDTVAVDVFTRAESVQFLSKRVPQAISSAEADHLAEELGDLPLALEQAGALQAETGMSVSEYLRLLRERTSQLLLEGKPSEYPAPMTAAWALSVSSLAEKMPEAVELLRCCAFFGPEPIPRDVFSRPRPGLGPKLTSLLDDPIRLTRAIREMGRYALARIDSPSRTIQVHRLIQALLRDEVAEAARARIRNEVHLLLAQAAPRDPEDTKHWDRYQQLVGHIEPSLVRQNQDPEVRDFALKMVRYLYTSGDYAAARSLVNSLLDEWAADAEQEDVLILRGRRHLGNILRALGEYNAAYEVNKNALASAKNLVVESGAENLLLEKEREVLVLTNSLGADLRAHGEFTTARDHDADSLERHKEVFGKSHLETLRAMNNLALDHGLNSDYIQAKEFHEVVFRGLNEFQNQPDQPSAGEASLLNAWTGLARAVRLCGDYSEACDLGEDAYDYGVEKLGPDHPWTLRTAKDLSIAWRRIGDYDRSLELAEDMHARHVRLFGLNHPDTLAAAIALANILRAMGQLEAALELASDTVRRYPRVYGGEHPFTHGCAGNLALLRRVCGDPKSARETNEKALEGLEAKLGRDHHYSLTVAGNLASDLAALGDHEAACRLGRGTLRRIRDLLGPAHPMTLACAANLSVDLREVGEAEQAEQLFEEAIETYARTLGPEHPDAVVAQERRHLDADFDPPPI